MEDNKKIIVILGPTASGKSDLSIFLAEKLNSEIICADSIQIYKNLNIISAKPNYYDLKRVKHHLIDFLDEHLDYSVFEFKKSAELIIENLFLKNVLPIVVGGTGLYIDSLINNIEFSEYSVNSSVRRYYENVSKTYCKKYLYELLKIKDKDACKNLHYNNIIRVIRFLEILDTSDLTINEYKKNAIKDRKYNVFFIGLNYRDRKLLYDKINYRVDLMLDKGLVDEAYSLYKMKNVSRNLDMAIGYKELKPYFEKQDNLNVCIEEIKKNSRRYAKRQITWFNRNEDIKWFYLDEYKDKIHMYEKIFYDCKQFLKGN